MTRARTIAEAVGTQITQGRLGPGARLPSVRHLASREGVSPATVVRAYDELQARGLVEGRSRSGFFVRAQPGSGELAQAVGAAMPHAAVGDPLDAASLLRGMFQGGAALPAPGFGTIPASWLDLDLLMSFHGAAARAERGRRQEALSLRYGDPCGDPAFRVAVSGLVREWGVKASAEQVVSCFGATHALDIVMRTLLAPGDAVLVDVPGWPVEYARLARAGMRLLPVPRTADGPDFRVMEALCREYRPRAYTTVSVLHNPTGYSISWQAAHQVLRLAEVHDFMVVEDDSYAWLASPGEPRLAALDGLKRTIHVGGFSKILTPNWRVGFIAAPARRVPALVDTKLLTSLTTPALTERAIAHGLEGGAIRRHAQKVAARLTTARRRTERAAVEAGCRFVAPPAGLFGWLDTGCDTERLAHRLLDLGWLIAPGHLFFPAKTSTTLMRINFASAEDPAMWHALRQVREEVALGE